MDITNIVIGVFLGIGLVFLYIAYRVRSIIINFETAVNQAVTEIKDSFMPVRVEKDKDTYFLYDKESNDFICQGKTLQELRDSFALRFPDKYAYLADGDQSLIDQLLAEKKTLE